MCRHTEQHFSFWKCILQTDFRPAHCDVFQPPTPTNKYNLQHYSPLALHMKLSDTWCKAFGNFKMQHKMRIICYIHFLSSIQVLFWVRHKRRGPTDSKPSHCLDLYFIFNALEIYFVWCSSLLVHVVWQLVKFTVEISSYFFLIFHSNTSLC